MQWKHLKTGGLYEILDHGLIEATLQPVVIYRKVDGDHSGSTWVRPTKEFMDGRFAPVIEDADESEEHPRSIPRMSKIEIGDTVFLDRTLDIPDDVVVAWNDTENNPIPTTDVIKQFESKEVVLLFHRNIFFPIKYLKKVQET